MRAEQDEAAHATPEADGGLPRAGLPYGPNDSHTQLKFTGSSFGIDQSERHLKVSQVAFDDDHADMPAAEQ